MGKNILCKILIEVNADKVERAIEEAKSKCAKASEYIAESEDIKNGHNILLTLVRLTDTLEKEPWHSEG